MTPRQSYRPLATWLIVFVLWFTASPVFASPQESITGKDNTEWQQIKTEKFLIVFPKQFRPLIEEYHKRFGTELDNEYTRLARLYGIDLALPVIIRAYSDEGNFQILVLPIQLCYRVPCIHILPPEKLH
jgi:hypothetical protein